MSNIKKARHSKSRKLNNSLIKNEEHVAGLSRRQVLAAVGGVVGGAAILAASPGLSVEEAYAAGYKAGTLKTQGSSTTWNLADSQTTTDIESDIAQLKSDISSLNSSNTTIQNNIDGMDAILNDIIVVSNTEPTGTYATKRLWIDTNMMGVIKYHNGTKWVPCVSVWG